MLARHNSPSGTVAASVPRSRGDHPSVTTCHGPATTQVM